MTDIRGPDIGARLDRLPPTRYIWSLVGLVSFGAFFEIYDLSLTAPLSLGLLVAGVFHRGAAGLFGFTDQATFAAATFAGLYVGTLGFSAVADRLGRRPVFTFALLWYATATVVMGLQNSAFAIDLCRFVASMGVGLTRIKASCFPPSCAPARSVSSIPSAGFRQFFPATSLPRRSIVQAAPGCSSSSQGQCSSSR
jgi:putative MFS transporter